MTARLILGIDPGISGAVAALADAKFAGAWDLPQRTRRNGRQELDGHAFGRIVRDLVLQHSGAQVTVVLEQVHAMPPRDDKSKPPCASCGRGFERGMGVAGAFSFGEGFGRLRGILEALDLPTVLVAPAKWKKDTGLIGADKDYSRTVAMQCYPAAAQLLQRKKDDGRAEAILLARWGDRYEAATGGNLVPVAERPPAPSPDLFRAEPP